MIAELGIFTAWVAIIGFWTTVVIYILRKPISEAIATRTASNLLAGEQNQISVRIAQLEAQVDTLEKELHLLRESNEFATKLLEQNEQAKLINSR